MNGNFTEELMCLANRHEKQLSFISNRGNIPQNHKEVASEATDKNSEV